MAGFEPKIVIESTQWLGKQGLVAAGLGITLIPTIVLDSVREDIVLRSLASEGLSRQLFIATDGCRYQAPGVEPMKDDPAPGRARALLRLRRARRLGFRHGSQDPRRRRQARPRRA